MQAKTSSPLSFIEMTVTVQSLYHKNALTELNQTMSLILVAKLIYRRLMLAGHSVIFYETKAKFLFPMQMMFYRCSICIKYV